MKRFILLCTIYYQAIIHGFDPGIITAQCFVESGFNVLAKKNTCVGIMQVDLKWWAEPLSLDESRMLELNYNLCAGLCVLRIYYKQTGDIWKALFRYNNGYLHNNQNYLPKIKKAMKKLYGVK